MEIKVFVLLLEFFLRLGTVNFKQSLLAKISPCLVWQIDNFFFFYVGEVYMFIIWEEGEQTGRFECFLSELFSI